MNVLMLGNGFDINYMLLTKYINFLNTVNFLSGQDLTEIHTVGDVLGAGGLHRLDSDIEKSYQKYKDAYDNTLLPKEDIERISELVSNNNLFSYFINSVNRDLGWIDFEKELMVIIEAFREFLAEENVTFNAERHSESRVNRYIIGAFDYFYKPANPGMGDIMEQRVKHKYTIEYPYGSFNSILNKEKIIATLEQQMVDVAECLRIYLKCFVGNVVGEMSRLKYLQQIPALTGTHRVVTFNYTNTYEQLYTSEKVYHIHGSIRNRVIIGVNPDETDAIDSIDISFLRFKKYFQRVIQHSDDEYLGWITSKHNIFSLVVMGHSLDITDKDIIMQMFDAAKDITVLYHNESAEASLVANLINIYGKEKFDELRIKKRLRFLPQNAAYKGFAEDRKAKETAAMARSLIQMTTV